MIFFLFLPFFLFLCAFFPSSFTAVVDIYYYLIFIQSEKGAKNKIQIYAIEKLL